MKRKLKETKGNDVYRCTDNPQSKYYIHDNELKCAREVVKKFAEGFNYVIIEGFTQAGKTNSMIGTANIILREELFKPEALNIKSFYYITGMNDCAPTEQISVDFAEKLLFNDKIREEMGISVSIKKNSNLQDDLDKGFTGNLSNALIFIDESHFGTKEDDSSVNKWLLANGIDYMCYNQKEQKERNIYIVSVSATPYEELYSDKKSAKAKVILHPAEGYVFSDNFNLVGVSDLERRDNAARLNNFIKLYNHCAAIEKIRPYAPCVVARLADKELNPIRSQLQEYFDILELNEASKNLDPRFFHSVIRDSCKLGSERSKDKFLLVSIKGSYRLSQRISPDVKELIGGIYDVSATRKNKNATSIATTEQGLLGRMCGYWNYDGKLMAMISEEDKKTIEVSMGYFHSTGKYPNKALDAMELKINSGTGSQRMTDIEIIADAGTAIIDVTDYFYKHNTVEWFKKGNRKPTLFFNDYAAHHHESIETILNAPLSENIYPVFDESETPVDSFNPPIPRVGSVYFYDEGEVNTHDVEKGLYSTMAYKYVSINERCFGVTISPVYEEGCERPKVLLKIRQGYAIPKLKRTANPKPRKTYDTSKSVA